MCRSAPFVLKIIQKTTDTMPKDRLLRDMLRLPERKILRTRQKKIKYAVVYPMHCSLAVCPTVRGGVRSTRGLGPTMTARGQSIGISIAMLPQTLIMSRLDQLS